MYIYIYIYIHNYLSPRPAAGRPSGVMEEETEGVAEGREAM